MNIKELGLTRAQAVHALLQGVTVKANADQISGAEKIQKYIASSASMTRVQAAQKALSLQKKNPGAAARLAHQVALIK